MAASRMDLQEDLFSKEDHQRLPISSEYRPIQAEDAFDRTIYMEETAKTAKEIRSIREDTLAMRQSIDQAIFDDRNAANKRWMDIQKEGESARKEDFIRTIEALEDIEEREEEFMYKQRQATENLSAASGQKLKKLEAQMVHDVVESKEITEKRLQEISLTHNLEMELIEKQAQIKHENYYRDLEKITMHHNAEQEKMDRDFDSEMKQMRTEFDAKIMAERKKQEVLKSTPGRSMWNGFCKFVGGAKSILSLAKSSPPSLNENSNKEFISKTTEEASGPPSNECNGSSKLLLNDVGLYVEDQKRYHDKYDRYTYN